MIELISKKNIAKYASPRPLGTDGVSMKIMSKENQEKFKSPKDHIFQVAKKDFGKKSTGCLR